MRGEHQLLRTEAQGSDKFKGRGKAWRGLPYVGAVCDLEVDLCSGTVCSIVVPGPPKMWGLLKSDEELVIPFCKINKIGDDVILVDIML